VPDDEGREHNPEHEQENERLPDELSAEDGARLKGLKLSRW
jgi:hypothetical protein